MGVTSGAGLEAMTSRRWRKKLVVGVLAFDVAVAIIGPVVDTVFWETPHYTGLMSGSAAIGLVTLVGFIFILRSMRGVSATDAVRDSIAVSFVAVFLVIIGWAAFYSGYPGKDLPPLAAGLLPNFISLVGVVLAFYFGTTSVDKFVEAKYESIAKNQTSQFSQRVSDVEE